MMTELFLLAQQRLSFVQEARAGLLALWQFFMRTLRDGRIAWPLAIVAAVLAYQLFFKKK